MTDFWSSDRQPLDDLSRAFREFARQTEASGRRVDPAAIPSPDEIGHILQTVFWATTKPDEGRYPRFSVAFLAPEPGCFRLRPQPFNVTNVARLSTVAGAPNRVGVHRGADGALEIWGINPGGTSYVEVRGVAPAHVVVAMGPSVLGVLRQQTWRSLLKRDNRGTRGLSKHHIVGALAQAFSSSQRPAEFAVTGAVLAMLLTAMRAHGNGGTLVVLPENRDLRLAAEKRIEPGFPVGEAVALQRAYEIYVPQLEKVEDPLESALWDTELGIAALGRVDPANPLNAATAAMGNLTALDGAVVLTERLELLSFGSVLRGSSGASDEPPTILRKSILDYGDDSVGGDTVTLHELGGTRRQSAAAFVLGNYDTLALIASHDGPLSMATWVAKDPKVPRAHLVNDLEMLLD